MKVKRTILLDERQRIMTNTEFRHLPAMDRWLFKEHAIDTVSVNGSILSGYATYRALPIPRGGDLYGAYNWRMTEHHWLTDPFSMDNELSHGTGYTEIWPKNYNKMIGNPENSDKRADWSPQADPNAHSPAFVFTNRRIDDEIKGGGNTTVNVV